MKAYMQDKDIVSALLEMNTVLKQAFQQRS